MARSKCTCGETILWKLDEPQSDEWLLVPRADAYIDFDRYSFDGVFCSSCHRLWIDWPDIGMRSLLPEVDDAEPTGRSKRLRNGGPGEFDRLFQKVLTQTRYQGTYEFGRWIAYIVDGPTGLPPDSFGEDNQCRNWWQDGDGVEHPRTARIGRGPSADDALVDLGRRWRDAGAPETFDWNAG